MTRSTGHQEVGELGEVDHEHLVRDCLTECHRERHLRCLELLRVEHALHGDDLRLLVWHLNTYRSLTGDRRDDTDTQGSKTQSDIRLKAAYLTDSHTLGRRDLIERHCRTHRSIYLTDGDAKALQHLHDTGVVRLNLVHINDRRAVVFIQQIKARELILGERLPRIDRRVKVNSLRCDIFRSHSLHLWLGDGISQLLTLTRRSCRCYLTRSSFRLLGFIKLGEIGEVHDIIRLTFLRNLIIGWFLHIIIIRRISLTAFILGTDSLRQIFVICYRVIVDRDLYLVVEIFDRVKNLTDDLYCLMTEIGKESNGCDDKQCDESGCSDNILEALHTEQAMHATGVIDLITHERS